jgi:redox-sensitive bicupin YhaK (pirin superfamily)
MSNQLERNKMTDLNPSNHSFHKANSRGYFDFGWLKTNHSFSFGNYFNPERIHFGALRVLNDDWIAPGMGFGTHPHDNMEIVTIPWLGSLAHKDSMGNVEVIKKGEVQIMSAGTGITHSEFNASNSESAEIFQIWVLPKIRGIKPRYGQKQFPKEGRENSFQLIVSPNGNDASPTGPVWINQDAYFSLADLKKGTSIQYNKFNSENWIYIFIMSGEMQIGNQNLLRRDGIGLMDNSNSWIAKDDSEILVIEIPSL